MKLFSSSFWKRQKASPLGLLLCLILALGLGLGCTRTTSTDTSSDALAKEGPDQESWSVHYQLQEQGHKRLDIHAGYMAYHEEEDSSYTLMEPAPNDSTERQVKVVWFDRSGDSAGTMYSNRLLYFKKRDELVAKEDVKAVMKNNRTLHTEQLRWNGPEETIYVPGFVRIITPTERIQGYQLVADEKFESYSLARVTGQVHIQEDD